MRPFRSVATRGRQNTRDPKGVFFLCPFSDSVLPDVGVAARTDDYRNSGGAARVDASCEL
ncbi:hypothetical protein EYF80_055960 [Liparis tanakae]|uniref:Uncharacterized protein n=1 Tax=Liparis tanakae TaxID=230148 RepID=A0A4Z2EY49_9TELE|nr:hypothetical protein EYF80_055960 [Liparis tanakae]